MEVIKRNNERERFKIQKIEKILNRACKDLPAIKTEIIQTDIELQLFDGIKTTDIHQGLISASLQHIQSEPEYSDLAARLLLFDVYKQSLGKNSFEDLNHSFFVFFYLRLLMD